MASARATSSPRPLHERSAPPPLPPTEDLGRKRALEADIRDSRNGAGSPRTKLPSFENLASGVPTHGRPDLQDDAYNSSGKRRRVTISDRERELSLDGGEGSGRGDGGNGEYASAEEARYYGEGGGTGVNGGVDGGNATSSSGSGPVRAQGTRRPSVLAGGPDSDAGYEGSVLARRRGDAAQAKASRLYIDTGSASSNNSFDQVPSARSLGAIKSAPPHKISFNGDRDRDLAGAPPLELRRSGDRDPGRNPPQTATYGPPGYVTPGDRPILREEVYIRGDDRMHSSVPFRPGEAAAHQIGRQSGGMQQPGSARFVPQTATLPSPAYHTTAFVRHPAGPPQASATHPPRTAIPNPPPTARLPESHRSPPSSKTQFLSLFANFYDSLSDSRTLKATLEDQVRRSNTLLQTLQRSSKVLEETVDRRLREERVVWESRVRELEDRIIRLESGGGGSGSAGEASGSGRVGRTSSKRKDDEPDAENDELDDEEEEDEGDGPTPRSTRRRAAADKASSHAGDDDADGDVGTGRKTRSRATSTTSTSSRAPRRTTRGKADKSKTADDDEDMADRDDSTERRKRSNAGKA